MSDVVADVSVPRTGDMRESSNGGRMSDRIGVGGGRRQSVHPFQPVTAVVLSPKNLQGSEIPLCPTPQPHRLIPYPTNPSPTHDHPT